MKFIIELIPPYSQPVDIETLLKLAKGCTIEKVSLSYEDFKLKLSNWFTFDFYYQAEGDYTIIFSNLLSRDLRGKTISDIELQDNETTISLYISFQDTELVGSVIWSKDA